jgi:hypothetical protein
VFHQTRHECSAFLTSRLGKRRGNYANPQLAFKLRGAIFGVAMGSHRFVKHLHMYTFYRDIRSQEPRRKTEPRTTLRPQRFETQFNSSRCRTGSLQG